MRGDQKRRAIMFKKKCIPYNKGVICDSVAGTLRTAARKISRPPSTGALLSASASDCQQHIMILYPRAVEETHIEHVSVIDPISGNRIVNNQKMMDAINSR